MRNSAISRTNVITIPIYSMEPIIMAICRQSRPDSKLVIHWPLHGITLAYVSFLCANNDILFINNATVNQLTQETMRSRRSRERINL